jgi:hypothetical protein
LFERLFSFPQRAHRKKEREHRKLGLPPPELPEELMTPLPEYVPLAQIRATEAAIAAAAAAATAAAQVGFASPASQGKKLKQRTPKQLESLQRKGLDFESFLTMYVKKLTPIIPPWQL